MAGKRSAASEAAAEVSVTSRDLSTLTELDLASLDPKFEYRWVHKSPFKVARAKARGYVIVRPEEEEGILSVVGDSPEASDGTFSIGDVILMKLAKAEHRARRHMVARKTTARLKAPTKKFKKDAAAASEQRGQVIEVITDREPAGAEEGE